MKKGRRFTGALFIYAAPFPRRFRVLVGIEQDIAIGMLFGVSRSIGVKAIG
jgi:hypothetical protein